MHYYFLSSQFDLYTYAFHFSAKVVQILVLIWTPCVELSFLYISLVFFTLFLLSIVKGNEGK